jgi:2,4-dienoyl-CoA reductase-like NADH-dependent reductase (Old Yellow Enzyme family)
MSEQLATLDHRPTADLIRLYTRWACGGAGLLVTGNVMIDRSAVAEPRNVVLEDARDLPRLAQWAQVGRGAGVHLWVQLNHPGRQALRFLSPQPVAPSAVPMRLARRAFAAPRALTAAEIPHLIERYAGAAALAKTAGFTGVQIHAAHGYLISQFLSPLTNRRSDAWGGTPAKRRRFLLEIYRATRTLVGREFPIGVKLNSADFQRGGYTAQESLEVAQVLAHEGVDVLEISGGTYESPVMVGPLAVPQPESTRQREAYFLDYVRQVRHTVATPLMLTGGFRSRAAMTAAIAEGSVDIIGLARPMAVEPDLPARLLTGQALTCCLAPRHTGIKRIDRLGLLEVVWYTQQIQRLGAGKETDRHRSPWTALRHACLTTCRDVLCRYWLRRGKTPDPAR